MPKLRKEILPEGEYLVGTSSGGRTMKAFSRSYLELITKNSNDMIAAGLNIPAPFKHLKEAFPKVHAEVDTNSFDNAGYWESFEVADKDGKAVLYGVIDAPGDTANLSTPAGKVTTTAKEVSVCVKESWQDGLNRSWGPCILHCAPVLHPVVPGQEGFTLIDDSVVLSLSGLAVETNAVNLSELSQELSKSAGIYIPPDTMLSDLPKVLLTVLRQKQLCDEVNNDDTEIVEPVSVFMSLPEGIKMSVSKANAELLVSLGAINPKTQKPFVLEDFEIGVDPRDTYAMSVTSELVEQRKKELRNRINTLISTGRTQKEYAEATLFPMVDTYELSLGQNAKVAKNNVDVIIESLEAIPVATKPITTNAMPTGSDIHEMSMGGDGNNQELTAEQAEQMKKEYLSMMG